MPTLPPPPGHATESSLIAPVSTPHWGVQSGSAFTVRATTHGIRAPVDRVLRTLLTTSYYPKWNNFVPRVVLIAHELPDNADGTLHESVLFTEHVDMFGKGEPSGLVRMKLLMTTLKEVESEDRRKIVTVVWLGKGYPDWALRSERVHEISMTVDGLVMYDVYETFSGPLAPLVKLLVGNAMVKRFRQWNDELKGYAEDAVKSNEGKGAEAGN